MPAYAWTCLACEATNAAQRSICGQCQCPAAPTSTQVESARSAYRRRAGLPPVERTDALALVKSLPLLLIAAGALVLLGGLSLIVGTNASMYAFGGLLLALAAFCASTHWNDVLGFS